MDQWIFGILYFAVIIGVPVVVVWGWARWLNSDPLPTVWARLAISSFILATTSAALAVATFVLALLIAFPFYDPTLLAIYKIGLLLSLAGAFLGLYGVLRPGPLRWHALLSSLGMLIFWFISASME